MITAIKSTKDRAVLRIELYEKQQLYKQMLKDEITGQVLKEVETEIGQLLLQLYGHENNQQRA